MCLWKNIRQRTGGTKDYFRSDLRRRNMYGRLFCFSMSKAVCSIANLLHFHNSGCNANVSLFKSWFRIPGNTTGMDFIKKQGANLASWKASVAKRLSFPGGFIFTIPAPFHFCSVGTWAKRCCWKRILCFKNEDKILWQAAKDYLLMSGALQRIWSQLCH